MAMDRTKPFVGFHTRLADKKTTPHLIRLIKEGLASILGKPLPDAPKGATGVGEVIRTILPGAREFRKIY